MRCKTLLFLMSSGLFSGAVICQTTNFDYSPYNMRNSPYNMDNSPYNVNSTNGVYDNAGNRIGYEVKAPSGVTNYFDSNGNRIGYSPAKK